MISEFTSVLFGCPSWVNYNGIVWPFGYFDTGSCYVGLDVRELTVQTKLVSFLCCFSCLCPLSSVIIGVCRHTLFFSILCKGGGGGWMWLSFKIL